jgi:hypothetical protein
MRFLPVLVLAALISGCGYVGDPLPPALNIPVRPENFEAFQRADKIVVAFRQSDLTTEALRLPRLGEPQLEVEGEIFEVPEIRPGDVRFELPAKQWEGRSVSVRARSSNGRGKYSEWTPPVRLAVVAPLAAPTAVQVQSAAEGVRVLWTQPEARTGISYRVTRKSKTDTRQLTAPSSPFLDREAQIGVEYQYQIEAVLGTAFSQPSAPVSLVFADRNPPPAPTGLNATVTLDSIELTWERAPESEPVSFRILRAEGSGNFAIITENLATPVYSDRAITKGASYRYAVVSVDQSGNESKRAEIGPLEVK